LKHLAWAITLRPTRHHFTHPHPNHALTVPVHYYYYPTGNTHTHTHTHKHILTRRYTRIWSLLHVYCSYTVYSEYIIILQQSYRELDNLTREKHPHTHVRMRINTYTETHTHMLNIGIRRRFITVTLSAGRQRRRRGHGDGRTRWKRPCVIIPFGKTHWKLHGCTKNKTFVNYILPNRNRNLTRPSNGYSEIYYYFTLVRCYQYARPTILLSSVFPNRTGCVRLVCFLDIE